MPIHMLRSRAFTLLEVALIVAIIGMMLMMIVGYLFAPKDKGPLPPVAEPTPTPSASVPRVPVPSASTPPAAHAHFHHTGPDWHADADDRTLAPIVAPFPLGLADV